MPPTKASVALPVESDRLSIPMSHGPGAKGDVSPRPLSVALAHPMAKQSHPGKRHFLSPIHPNKGFQVGRISAGLGLLFWAIPAG